MASDDDRMKSWNQNNTAFISYLCAIARTALHFKHLACSIVYSSRVHIYF